MAERRLAITIKGGVSLGAYEAGVLTETLRLIAFNNQQGTDGHSTAVPWYIDTLAGASAGAVTGTIVARILVDNRTFVRQSDGHPVKPEDLLRQIWVEDISLDRLLARPPNNTLLDSTALSSLAADYFSNFPDQATLHPAVRPDEDTQIRLGLSLSALDPGQEHTETLNGYPLNYNEYARKASFQINVGTGGSLSISAIGTAPLGYNEPGDALEGPIAYQTSVEAAITSASFPLAFAPRGLARKVVNGWGNQYFVDGGVYDNDPVGEMINIAHDLDWESHTEVDDVDRRFLIINTEPPAVDQPLKGKPISGTDLLDVGAADIASTLVSQILEESADSGLRGIGKINRQIDTRNRLLKAIAAQFAALQAPGTTFDFQGLATRLQAAVELLQPICGLAPDRLQIFRTFFIGDLAAVSESLSRQVNALNPDARRAFVEFGLFYDLASDLADKVPFHPIVIGPEENLAGARLLAFGGFLLQELRAHDFDQGRADAYTAWEKISKRPEQRFILSRERPPQPQPFDWTADRKKRYQEELDKFQHRINVVVENAIQEELPAIPILDRVVSGVIASVASIIIDKLLDSGSI
jgi:hypothetical protein